MTEFVDTIVAGGGTAGSAAAWQLARRGAEVLLLEACPTVGEAPARAFEVAYADPVYQALAAESVALWSELEAETGASVLQRTAAVVHGHAARIELLAESIARARVASELLSVAEAESRWPGLRFSGNVLFAPQGGRLREEVAIAALQSAASASGAQLGRGVTITRVRILGDDLARIEVRATDAVNTSDASGGDQKRPASRTRTDATGGEATRGEAAGGNTRAPTGLAGLEPGEVREIDCRRLVVALGPSTARLLRGLLSLPRLSSARDVSLVLAAAGEEVPAVLHLPDPTAPGQRYWRGDATVLGVAGSIAVGWRDAGAVADSSASALPSRESAALLRYAREWVPGADPEVPTPTSRVRTSAHHGDFVVDRIGPVTIGAGFGADGAGLAPAVGRLLAGLTDGITAPGRFALRPDRRRSFEPPVAHEAARRA